MRLHLDDVTLDLAIPHLLAALLAGGAIVLGLVVGIVLLVRPARHRLARGFLGGFLVAGALSLTNELVFTLDLPRLSAHFWVTPLLYTFSLGPLVFFFVRQRLRPDRPLATRDLWHAVVPAVQIVHEVVSGFGTLALKTAYWESGLLRIYGNIEIGVFIVSFGGYLLASWRVLGATPSPDQDSGELASGEARMWLRRLVVGCAVIVVVALIMETPLVAPFLWQTVGQETFQWLRLVEMMAYSALLYWVAFTGFVHTLPKREAPAPKAARAETYGLTPEAVAGHVAALRSLMADERPYLDPDLTLGALADRLRLSEKELSYVLNEGLGAGYTDYVNGFRVGEAQRLLALPERSGDSVLQIGMEAGFASKATFNRVFKRETGQTPTQYRTAPEAGARPGDARLNPS